MAIEQKTTLRVVHAGAIVEAQCAPSGIAGLALVGRPVTTGWRLVHMATGRAVSRSAEHTDAGAVRELARRIAPLADWTEPNVAVTVPRLRQDLDRVISDWRGIYGSSLAGSGSEPSPNTASHREFSGSEPVVPQAPERDLSNDLETLANGFRAAERERHLLREVVRRLHAALPLGVFADALSNLSHHDREFVRSLVADENAEDATGVVQAIRRAADVSGPRTTTATPNTVVTASSPRPAPTSPRTPSRRRAGHFDGPDVAAS